MITATQLRQWLNEYEKEQISFSRLLELVNEEDKKIEAGMMAVVTDCLYGHEFEMGEIVQIIGRNPDDDFWIGRNSKGSQWFLQDEELKVVIQNSFIPITDDNKPDEGQIVWVTDGYRVALAKYFPKAKSWREVSDCEIEGDKLVDFQVDYLDFTPTHFHPTPDFSQFKKEK